jgi:hypothetical protein
MSADAAHGIDVQLQHVWRPAQQDKTDRDGANGPLVGCLNGVVFAGDSLHLRQAVGATRTSGVLLIRNLERREAQVGIASLPRVL